MSRKLLATLVLSVTAIGLIYVNLIISNNLTSERNSRIAVVQENTIREFESIIEQFGLFVSSTRSYLNQSGEIPSQQELFEYLQGAASNTDLEGNYILSVMDSTHTFLYSFDHDEVNPSGLVGKSLLDFADSSAIRKYNEVMMDDQLYLFKPHNLIEGRVGISINFRLLKEGFTGYVIPIIDLKAALEEVYQQPFADEFIFHFSTGEGVDFDRERVYDGSKVHHDRVDSLYYGNFTAPSEEYLYDELNIYGFDFRIGTAYRQPAPFNWWPLASTIWFIVLLSLTLYINHQSSLLEKANDDLQVANEAKRKFFAILGHDVKGPLKIIQSIMQIRKLGKIDDTLVDASLEQLSDATDNTVNLVDNLLEWAQVNGEKVTPTFEPVDLTEILSDVVQLHKSAADIKEIDLKTEHQASLVIEGDSEMLKTIFRNLIGNALKFTDRLGNVKVNSHLVANKAVIEITDNGIGMTPKQMASMFRLDKEEKTTKGTEGERGTGLGMLLVQEYTNIHSGQIQVDSKQQKGTTFTLSFPLLITA